MTTLTEKGTNARATIARVKSRLAEMAKLVQELERVAVLYECGVDPADIEAVLPVSLSRRARIRMKSGEVLTLPRDVDPELINPAGHIQ